MFPCGYVRILQPVAICTVIFLTNKPIKSKAGQGDITATMAPLIVVIMLMVIAVLTTTTTTLLIHNYVCVRIRVRTFMYTYV